MLTGIVILLDGFNRHECMILDSTGIGCTSEDHQSRICCIFISVVFFLVVCLFYHVLYYRAVLIIDRQIRKLKLTVRASRFVCNRASCRLSALVGPVYIHSESAVIIGSCIVCLEKDLIYFKVTCIFNIDYLQIQFKVPGRPRIIHMISTEEEHPRSFFIFTFIPTQLRLIQIMILIRIQDSGFLSIFMQIVIAFRQTYCRSIICSDRDSLAVLVLDRHEFTTLLIICIY